MTTFFFFGGGIQKQRERRTKEWDEDYSRETWGHREYSSHGRFEPVTSQVRMVDKYIYWYIAHYQC